jgi:GT2 family glycosyltransferase
VRVLACVVNWNTAEQLPQAIESLLSQDGLAEVVVVDNASHDGSAEVVRRYPDVRLVANDENRGFAGAANQGVELARRGGHDALLTCNPDVRLEAGHVEHVVAALARGPRRASVQGRLWRMEPGPAGERIVDTTGHLAFRTRLFRNRGEGQPDTGQFDEPAEVFGVSGALALYRLAALDDVAVCGEVFDEHLFAFWEDVDLDWRLRRRGWEAWYEPTATAWHERGGAGPRRSAVVEELNFANRFLVLVKNDDPRVLVRDAGGVALTSVLKAGELAVTVPSAFVRSLGRARRVGAMLEKRREVQRTATVGNDEVLARWFEPFDYASWVRAWWRRVRREAAGR